MGDHGVRVEPVQHLDAEQQELLQATLLGPEGQVRNVFATLAHHPALLRRFNVLGGLFMTRGCLPPRTRELVILRVAVVAGSTYEYHQHLTIAREAGLSAEEIERVGRDDLAGWSEPDAALVGAVDQLLEERDLDDVHWSALAAHLDEQQLLELTMLVGFYLMLAIVLRTVGTEVEEWQPDGG